MNGKNRAGTRSNGFSQTRRINVIGGCVWLYRDQCGADVGDGQPRGDEGIAGNDDFIAGANAGRFEGQDQRVPTIADPNAVLGAYINGIFPLEGVQFGTLNVPSTVYDPCSRFIKLSLNEPVDGLQVQKFDFCHPFLRTACRYS